MQRLENEDFIAYKKRRKEAKQMLKEKLKGKLFWYSRKLGAYSRQYIKN